MPSVILSHSRNIISFLFLKIWNKWKYSFYPSLFLSRLWGDIYRLWCSKLFLCYKEEGELNIIKVRINPWHQYFIPWKHRFVSSVYYPMDTEHNTPPMILKGYDGLYDGSDDLAKILSVYLWDILRIFTFSTSGFWQPIWKEETYLSFKPCMA